MANKLGLVAILGALMVPNAAAAPCAQQSFSHFVVVDQFGYQPGMAKIAVIRSPVKGFDAAQSFTPGPLYQVVEQGSCKVVYEGAPKPWKDGAIDPSSGDRAWHFDFSAVTAPGRYVIRDHDKNEISGAFTIAANPYREVLVQAVRFFYYQRANTPKAPPFADPRWSDTADHIGPRQDKAARHLMKKDDPSTERDLSGGWWDAGDFNRYTNWHSDYIISLIATYNENPAVFTDDFNIPESGNGIPDLLDEVKWGTDWLIKMQNPDGSVLAILHAGMVGSPPSSATNPSYYGGPSTSASYSAAAAFATAAKTLARYPALKVYAADLASRAKRAYAWAEAHPDVTFFNKSPAYGDQTLGGGEQEYSAKERPTRALLAAIYLYELTGEAAYQSRIAALVEALPLLDGRFSTPDAVWLQPLLHYAGLKSARRDIAEQIHAKFLSGFRAPAIYGGEAATANPYLAYLPAYFWGSSKEISRQGFFFLNPKLDSLEGAPADAESYAAHYLHYLHGVNPLAKVYLSNMGSFGAENSVDEFYHAWFAEGSRWQNVKTSPLGPPPGFLVGGPNPSYDWEKACPGLDARCGSARLSPPYGQPPQKSYADFSASYPIDSWQVTEPSAGYQVEYIRLLAHFVSAPEKIVR
ncbi:MAG: glycoside hydrolase family 9 protein [Rhizomicrobium sp.]|nr:glycoside hydrolase family 9 protein [Rhizomicrobium sp.]